MPNETCLLFSNYDNHLSLAVGCPKDFFIVFVVSTTSVHLRFYNIGLLVNTIHLSCVSHKNSDYESMCEVMKLQFTIMWRQNAIFTCSLILFALTNTNI